MKEDFKDLTQFKDFELKKQPPSEAYTFSGNGFEWGFTIVFSAGRIFLAGDAGENVFVIGGGTNKELKDWLINVNITYALSKSHQGQDYFDKEYAEQNIRNDLKASLYSSEKINSLIDQLDFESHDLLQISMRELPDDFPDFWELNLKDWSPMQKMQYKQLLFAGKYLKEMQEDEGGQER